MALDYETLKRHEWKCLIWDGRNWEAVDLGDIIRRAMSLKADEFIDVANQPDPPKKEGQP